MVYAVEPDSPAARVGLQFGDRIVAIDGQYHTIQPDLTSYMRLDDAPIMLKITRADTIQQIEIQPQPLAPQQILYRLIFIPCQLKSTD